MPISIKQSLFFFFSCYINRKFELCILLILPFINSIILKLNKNIYGKITDATTNFATAVIIMKICDKNKDILQIEKHYIKALINAFNTRMLDDSSIKYIVV